MRIFSFNKYLVIGMIMINKLLLLLGQGETKIFTDPRNEMFACEERGAVWLPEIKISHLFRTNLQVSWNRELDGP